MKKKLQNELQEFFLKGGIFSLQQNFSLLSVAGKDALSFLEGRLTVSLLPMKEGEIKPAALLNLGGKILFSFHVIKEREDLFFLLIEKEQEGDLQKELEKFVIAEDVSFLLQACLFSFRYGPSIKKHSGFFYSLPIELFSSSDEEEAPEFLPFFHLGYPFLVESPLLFWAFDEGKGCFLGKEVVSKQLLGRDVPYRIALLKKEGSKPPPAPSRSIRRVLYAFKRDGDWFFIIELFRDLRLEGKEIEGGQVFLLEDLLKECRQERFWSDTLYFRALELINFDSSSLKDKEAFHLLSSALFLDPQHFEAMEVMGVIKHRLEGIKSSIAYLEEVSRKFPRVVMFFTNLSRLYIELGDKEKAEEYRAQAISLEMGGKKNSSVSNEEEEMKKRKEMFEKVLDFDPHDDFALAGLATLLFKEGQFQRALSLVERIEEFSLEGYLLYGRLLVALGDNDKKLEEVVSLGKALALKKNKMKFIDEFTTMMA